jgi:threonylcarbamoyladenosine tRNA methylthiotransferase MtaB
MDWTAGLLALFSEFGGDVPRLARHAHLPLQSGSDAILRAMYRRYRPWHYAAKLETIHAALPDAAIGADVMVGFPGETDTLFEETYRFIEQQPFTYLSLFPFSARPGTAAWALHWEKPVPGEAVRERMARLRALIDARRGAFCAKFVGRELSVVTLQTSEGGSARNVTRALSDNFLSLELAADLPANQMLSAYVESVTENGLAARPIDQARVHGKITESLAPVAKAGASQMLY